MKELCAEMARVNVWNNRLFS